MKRQLIRSHKSTTVPRARLTPVNDRIFGSEHHFWALTTSRRTREGILRSRSAPRRQRRQFRSVKSLEVAPKRNNEYRSHEEKRSERDLRALRPSLIVPKGIRGARTMTRAAMEMIDIAESRSGCTENHLSSLEPRVRWPKRGEPPASVNKFNHFKT